MTHAQKTLDGWRFWVSCQHARKLNMYSKPSDENPGREDVFEDPYYVIVNLLDTSARKIVTNSGLDCQSMDTVKLIWYCKLCSSSQNNTECCIQATIHVSGNPISHGCRLI